MTMEDESQRAKRLARARAFLDAGRTQIDPAPPPVRAASGAENAAEAPGEDGDVAAPADPTRFGDWEKNGRCIDF